MGSCLHLAQLLPSWVSLGRGLVGTTGPWHPPRGTRPGDEEGKSGLGSGGLSVPAGKATAPLPQEPGEYPGLSSPSLMSKNQQDGGGAAAAAQHRAQLAGGAARASGRAVRGCTRIRPGWESFLLYRFAKPWRGAARVGLLSVSWGFISCFAGWAVWDGARLRRGCPGQRRGEEPRGSSGRVAMLPKSLPQLWER